MMWATPLFEVGVGVQVMVLLVLLALRLIEGDD